MANIEFIIEKSRFQETKFLESLKSYLYSNNIGISNSMVRGKTNITIGGENSGANVQYNEVPNPFDFKFGIMKFDLVHFIGSIKVDNIKTSHEVVDNENLVVYSYQLRGSIKSKTRKLFPIIIFILGIIASIGSNSNGGVIFSVFFIIIAWYITLKILGKIWMKKAIEKLGNILSNYVDII